MSLSNATENQTLKMLLQGTDPAYRADTTQYAALISANQSVPGEATATEANPIGTELSYTGYARIPLTKAGAWTDSGSTFTNAVQLLFGKRTDAGAAQQARAVVICDTASGPITLGIIVPLNDTLDVGLNIQPFFSSGDLLIGAE